MVGIYQTLVQPQITNILCLGPFFNPGPVNYQWWFVLLLTHAPPTAKRESQLAFFSLKKELSLA